MLAAERSLGSVIKLLTPDNHEFTPAYNAWLETIPQYIKELVFVVKRFHKPAWGDTGSHFTVDIVNGTPGNELKCDNRVCLPRRGFASVLNPTASAHVWVAQGFFNPAAKVQQGGIIITAFRAGAHPAREKSAGHDKCADDQVCRELRTTPFPASR